MNTRNYGMDLLRCLSIAFVVLAHLYLIYPPGGKMQAVSMVFSLLDGVTIFFVLSGFLIGYQLFSCFESAGNANNARLRRFFISRWFKTLPSYYTILILLYFLNYAYIRESGIQVSEYLIFIQNFNKNHPKFFLEAWSLSTEEWFYLATPALLLLLIKGLRIRPKLAFLYVSLLLWIGAHVTRLYYLYNASFATMEDFGLILRNRVLPRMDAPAFGILAAWLYVYRPSFFLRQNSKRSILLWILILLLVACNYFLYQIIKDGFTVNLGYHPVLGLSGLLYFDLSQGIILLLLPHFFRIKAPQNALRKVITYISKLSYSIYLVHSSLVIGSLLPFFNQWVGHQKIMMLMIYLVLVAICALLLYYVIEQPFFRLKKRLIKGTQPPSNNLLSAPQAAAPM